MCVQIVVIEE